MRACLAALGIQEEAKQLAIGIAERDGVELQLRVGLNSGQVIAGEIGSAALGYTAIGEQVGMAQRMESVAPPGGVMLSESTVRLVEAAAVLADPQLVRIKGAAHPVPARRLLSVTAKRTGVSHSTLVGREWELTTLGAMLDRAIGGRGCYGWRGRFARHRQDPVERGSRCSSRKALASRYFPPSVSLMPPTSRSMWWRACCAPVTAWTSEARQVPDAESAGPAAAR